MLVSSRYREGDPRSRGFLSEARLRLIVFISLLLLSLICLSWWGLRDRNPLAPRLSFISTPVNTALTQSGQSVGSRLESWSDILNLQEKVENLQAENQKLKEKIPLLESLKCENIRLRRLHGLAEKSPLVTVPADIIGRGGEQFRTLLLNRGSHSGVAVNQPVITYEGLVGRVQAVHPYSCVVLQIIDPNSAIGVFVADIPDEATSSAVQGVVSGHRRHLLVLETREGKEVQPELPVYTSSVSTIYPPGIRLGTVWRPLESGYSLQKRYQIQPSVNFPDVREVLIVTGLHRQEAVALQDETR
jgi:rod shape-determining protein MreC